MRPLLRIAAVHLRLVLLIPPAVVARVVGGERYLDRKYRRGGLLSWDLYTARLR